MLALAALLAAVVAVPAEIQDHYRDHNFVSAFSTVSERHILAAGRRPSANTRGARVAAAMARLAGRIAEVDPGMVRDLARSSSEAVLRADLVRITSFESDGAAGEAWVHLETLRLDHPATMMLISKFDELASAGRQPAVDDLVEASGRTLVVSYEIHRWLRIDGTWRRDRATRHFLGSRARP